MEKVREWKKKTDWRRLVGVPNLCGGGVLASVVFCCGPEKSCPIRMLALAKLGVSSEDYRRIKEEHRVEAPETCFGNLAYCCSPEKPCPHRDRALRRLGWTTRRYLEYKAELLDAILEIAERPELAFTERIMKTYAANLLDLDNYRVIHALLFGNVELRSLMVQDIAREESADPELAEALRKTGFLAVRVPPDIVRRIDRLIEQGIVRSRSDFLRRAIAMYLVLLEQGGEGSGVKHG